ncbi:MAG: peptidoglycan DD-metalloendopeptidase family protein [Desulfurivibrionaceae bacterium]|nr:peptidoglycan DD-metalloendopeptidase family protein [Desulfurivibrionaceae bacterium]
MTCPLFQKPLFWALLIIMLQGVLLARPALSYEYGDDLGLEEAVRFAEQDLFEHKKKLRQVQQGLHTQQENFEQKRRVEENLLHELGEIESKIIAESQELVSLANQLQREKLQTAESLARLEAIQAEKHNLAQKTEKRLAAYYRMGDIGLLNITFSAATLPDLVTFHEYYRHMLRHDKTLIARFRDKIGDLEQSRQSHQEQQVELKEAMHKARQQQGILAATKEARKEVLGRIKMEKELYRQAADVLEEAARDLLTGLEDFEKESEITHKQKEAWMIATFPLEPHKKRRPGWMRGFAGQKGSMPPPVTGTLIGVAGDNAAALPHEAQPSHGVDFNTEPGALVRAVFKGKVVHAGFIKGYGQLVIISHNDDYYTMTSGMTTFMVKPGDRVNQGDGIGMASEHIGALRSPIHLEIRRKTEPEDPLAWLDPRQIVTAPGLR